MASHIQDLSARVDELSTACGQLSQALIREAPRIQALAAEAHQAAMRTENSANYRNAASALAEAVRTLSQASHYASQAQMRGRQYAAHLADLGSRSPVEVAAVAKRTSTNRINLADDVPDVRQTPEFGGYLDVVMHGDAEGTEAAIGTTRVPFTLDQVVAMVRSSPSWKQRPVRLLSCSTGQGRYAQDLANVLGVAVYAPSDVLSVADGIKVVLNDGTWRRFEPKQN